MRGDKQIINFSYFNAKCKIYKKLFLKKKALKNRGANMDTLQKRRKKLFKMFLNRVKLENNRKFIFVEKKNYLQTFLFIFLRALFTSDIIN